ncbi:MAG: hypothetical protein R3F53_15725 [Gammaproteobacteria bacterium]
MTTTEAVDGQIQDPVGLRRRCSHRQGANRARPRSSLSSIGLKPLLVALADAVADHHAPIRRYEITSKAPISAAHCAE